MPQDYIIVSSQYKHKLPQDEREIAEYAVSCGLALRNEPYSIQLLLRAPDSLCRPVSVAVDCELPVRVYRLDCVAVTNAANDYGERGYTCDLPGLYADLLLPRPAKPEIVERGGLYYEKDTEYLLNLNRDSYTALFVTLNPESETVAAGEYVVKFKITSLANPNDTTECAFSLTIVDAFLPDIEYYYTNWFHVDSLCDYYNVEPYSDEFYTLFDSFVRNAVRHRMNTLLLPAFTPALDTPKGSERRCVQLVDIERIGDSGCDDNSQYVGGGWRFGFERMRRFIRAARDCGISVFEHCHLFSQWGAASAPNIYDVTGKRLFGWETDASSDVSSDEYRGFVRAYLKAFLEFAASERLGRENLLFHISDEPTDKQIDGYRRAYETVADLLSGYDMIDALSDAEFYKTGLVRTPVAVISNADKFAEVCPRFWLYYTCGTYLRECSNRLITNTAARTRVLGLQLYYYKAIGFLHWGYNYYYDRMTSARFDPKQNPCGYKLLPGCSWLAYPLQSGAAPSLREEHMREVFDDLRLYKLLEERFGRERLLDIIESELGGKIGCKLIPDRNSLWRLREKLIALLIQ